MSKKLQVLYEEYKKSQKGYADGGEVEDDSALGQALKSIKNSFNPPPPPVPHKETREEKYAKIRQQNTERSAGTRPSLPSMDEELNKNGSNGYSEGGKIPHNKKNLEELKKAFAKFINEEGSEKGYADGGEVDEQSEQAPEQTPDQPGLTPEQFQQHLQDLQVQGNTLTGVQGDPQNVMGQLPPQTSLDPNAKPASLQDVQEPQSLNDKKLENDYQNEDFEANEKASDKKPSSEDESDEEVDDKSKEDGLKVADKQPNESAYSRLLASMNPQKMGRNELADAQRERDKNIALQNMEKGSALIGAGLSGVNPDRMLKLADQQNTNMPVQKYEEQIQNQQFDPDSKMSQTVREYLGAKGFKVPEGSSAADLFKIAPFLQKDQALQASLQKTIMGLGVKQSEGDKNRAEKQEIEARKALLYGGRTQAMKEKGQQSLSDKQDKDVDNDFTKLEKRLTAETGSSRSAFGKSANVVRSAEAAQALIDQVPGGNLDNRQIKELARSIDSMLSNGAATMTGSQGLIPSTYSGDAAKIEEYLTNQPKGAGQQAFVQRLNDTLKREKQIAQKQINGTQNKVLSAYSHLKKKAPDRYDDMMKAYGIQPMMPDQGKQPASDNSHPQDSQAVAWAKANPGDKRAKAILEANGVQ